MSVTLFQISANKTESPCDHWPPLCDRFPKITADPVRTEDSPALYDCCLHVRPAVHSVQPLCSFSSVWTLGIKVVLFGFLLSIDEFSSYRDESETFYFSPKGTSGQKTILDRTNHISTECDTEMWTCMCVCLCVYRHAELVSAVHPFAAHFSTPVILITFLLTI